MQCDIMLVVALGFLDIKDTMYEIPARKDVAEVVITAASVRGEEAPQYVLLRDTQGEDQTDPA